MLKQRNSTVISGIFLTFVSGISLAYQAVDLNIGRSVAFGYSTNLDQRRFGVAASGLWGLDQDNRLAAPAVRYTILPRTDQSFLDNVYVSANGFYADLGEYHDANIWALGFGGGARFKLIDEYSFLKKPVFLSSGINYAPPGTTWQDGENIVSWFARFEYPILERSLVYVGYRSITADVTPEHHHRIDDASIDKTVFVGIHYVF